MNFICFTLGNVIGFNDMNAYRIEKTEDSLMISYPGGTLCRLFGIVPGILIAMNHVEAEVLPAMQAEDVKILGNLTSLFTVNHTRSGICEMQTGEGNYIYVKGDTLCISRETAEKQFRYPTGRYEGIEIYFLENCEMDSSGLLKEFGIGVQDITSRYLKDNDSFLGNTTAPFAGVLQQLYLLFSEKKPDLPQIRLEALRFLRLLSAGETPLSAVPFSSLTPRQLAMAKSVREYLTRHLDQRIPVRKLADQQGVSETSLKNYFRAVYGQNISDYLYQKRMEQAITLLEEGSHSIGEIAEETGYQSQSRFGSAFRRYTGYTPSAWRKRIRNDCPPVLRD